MRKMRFSGAFSKGTIFLFGVLIIFWDTAHAQTGHLPDPVDLNVLFKAILSLLLAALVYIWKGTEVQAKANSKEIAKICLTNVDTENRLALVEREIELLKHQMKTNESLIALEREQRLTKYHDKEDTDKHRTHVEATLGEISKQIARLEALSQ